MPGVCRAFHLIAVAKEGMRVKPGQDGVLHGAAGFDYNHTHSPPIDMAACGTPRFSDIWNACKAGHRHF